MALLLTHQLPRAGVVTPKVKTTQRHWMDAWIVFAPLITATALSKFSVPPLGVRGIGLVFPVALCALVVGMLTERLQLVSRRLVLYLLMLSLLGLMQLLRGGTFSLTSVVLMAAIGMAYVPASRADGISSERAVGFFCTLTVCIAALGVVQFLLQFVGGAQWAFPIETWVPQEFRTLAYNNIIPLFWGSPILKANGMVMLEPSDFSQLCALGLIAELSSRNRLWRLALYAAALVVSYSGTGLVVLAVSLPLFVLMHRRWDLLLYGLLLLAVLVVFADALHLDATLRRVSELGATGSSGYARFVSWRDLFSDRLWDSLPHALFGYGAGSFAYAAEPYKAAEMAHAKIFFEFGLFGGLLYFCFVFYCMFSSRAPLILRIAVGIAYFMNGAYSPSITGIATSLLLWPHEGRPVANQNTIRGAGGKT